MADSWELQEICDRILNQNANEDDIAQLRQFITANSDKNVVQLGKYNVNIADGKDIHIGDKIYQGTDAETIRAILREVLSQNTQHIEIDWHDISQIMLSEQQRLTTNPLTSGEGISHRTTQVYVPLGLVERKKQTRRKEDVSPEQGSELYRETEITQTFEYQQFLQQVLKQRQSPKSQGKRIAIIGEPGAGKTTLLQQIASWVSGEIPDAIVIWISLADLQGQELEVYLFDKWLQAVARKVGQAEASTQVKDDFVAQFNRGLVWLLLDGVDEMQATQGNPLGECDRQLRAGSLLQQARIVLSCRLNLWDGGSNSLDSFDNYRTLEFSYPQQVEQFIGNWFASLPSAETQIGERLCAALAESGKERIRDLAKNPLRLTLLCFNWYLGEGKLPETKAGLYEQFVADFYEWKKGQFATTGEQRKRLNTALGELAREAIEKEATRFRLRQDFVCEYLGEPDDADSLFGLALRLGWLNKVGVDGDNPRKGVYGFFHPTFQEYFAALAIDDWHYFLNHIPDNPSHPNASYRIFEQQCREIFFLWIGFPQNNFLPAIEALMSFEDACKSWNISVKSFYEHQAYMIVIYCLMEIGIRKQYKEIFKEIVNYILNLFGEQKQHNYWLFLSDAVFPILDDLYTKNILQELFNLVNDQKTIGKTKQIILICREKQLREQNKIILKQNNVLDIITEIDKLIIKSNPGESITYRLSQLIELISKNNVLLIQALIKILNYEHPRHIKLKTIIALGLASHENLDAIAALNKEIESSPDLIYLFYTTKTLVAINPRNREAILLLRELMPTLHIYMQIEACELLMNDEEIAYDLFIKLIELIQSDPDDEVYYRACQTLKANINTDILYYSLLISKLRDCLTNKIYEDEFFRFRDCYELLWCYSQELSYKAFYEAWFQ
ncbi:NACHT domain-containing protein [Calothrix sp. PCC 6303]|uniref:NACHT domain-containing protein n=1 Tax=Calothrix sp. PCC 6303 TaxID=1170562 RepID=UPI0002A033B9|nr:NACHT domain-containing protein [Calothrix sp. PCC 6303]AFZ01288.1 putative signal transduction protein with Nacht domain [Calothrix sp. PCC 6303]